MVPLLGILAGLLFFTGTVDPLALVVIGILIFGWLMTRE